VPCSGAYPAKATSRSTCKLPPRTVSGLTSRLGEPGRRCVQRVSRVRVSTTNWFDDARPAPRTGPGRQIGLGSCVALGAAAFAGRVFATGRGGRLQTAVAAAATGTGSTVSATTDEASTAPSIADDLTNGCIGDPASAAAASGLAKACGSGERQRFGGSSSTVERCRGFHRRRRWRCGLCVASGRLRLRSNCGRFRHGSHAVECRGRPYWCC
jgi:hypothetical protein